jgi:hypothetical protein
MAMTEKDDAQLAMLQKKARDLADLVTEGDLKLNEAVACFRDRIWNKRTAKNGNSHRSELLQLLPDLSTLPARELKELERKHEEFAKRRDAFNALPKAEQIEMARFVLSHDPELADEVVQGYTPLFEAFHELKQAEGFLKELHRRGL